MIILKISQLQRVAAPPRYIYTENASKNVQVVCYTFDSMSSSSSWRRFSLNRFNHFLPGKEVKKQLLHMMITYFHSKILLNPSHVLQVHVLWARINPTTFPPHKPYLYRARIYLNRREVGHMFPLSAPQT